MTDKSGEKEILRTIESEMKRAFIDYSMSVIMSRALPDVRDGLKPVHRRILYAMNDMGLTYNKPYKKSARVVGECFVENTMVLTERGLKPIKDIKRGDKVYTQNGIKKVKELYMMPKRELLKVTLENGLENKVTKSQKFKVLTKDLKFEWKEAKDLTNKDFVVVKYDYPKISNFIKLNKGKKLSKYLNENIGYLLGIFLSDGWISEDYGLKKYPRICFYGGTDKEIAEKVVTLVEKEFGYRPTIQEKKYQMKPKEKRSIYFVRINRKEINDFFVSNFNLKNVNAFTKKIPSQIFSSPGKIVYSFISGLIDGDGSVHKNRNMIHYGSISEELINQLMLLLQHNGIFSSKHIFKDLKTHYVANKKITDRHMFFYLEIHGSNAVELAKNLNLQNPRKKLHVQKIAEDSVTKRDAWSKYDIIPYSGEIIFGELSNQHLGGGWYKDTNGEKFRDGIKYSEGCKIRYSKDLKTKPLHLTQIKQWGVKEKLDRIGSGLNEFIEHILKEKISFFRVSSVKRIDEQVTYDIEVESDHEFIANGIVSHNCLGKYHPHGDQAVYDSMVRMAQDFSLRYPLVDGQGNFGCFTKDMEIALTDGRNLSFEKLIKEDKQGKRNYTYTINKNGNIGISEIKNPMLTKRNQKILKIVLDNNKEIKCTLDHKFMLRDGTYKEAQYLKSNDSLMPLYLRLSTEEDKKKPALQDYQMIYQPKIDTWDPVHKLADSWNIANNIYKRNSGRIRHHVDFNKLNNNPDNIRRIKWKDHWKLHAEHASELHKNEEYRKKISEGRNKYWSDPNNRKANSHRLSERNKRNWKNPKYREHMRKMLSEVNKEYIKNHPEIRKKHSIRATKTLKRLWKDPEYREMKSKSLKDKWKDPTYRIEQSERLKQISNRIWSNPKHKRHISQINKELWENNPERKEFYLKVFSKNGKNANYYRFLAVCKKTIEKYGTITKEYYEKIRVKYNSRKGAGIITFNNALEKFFDKDIKKLYGKLELENIRLNHKIKDIIFLDKKEDVYDITIEETHNFALASGVFVHNSIDGDSAAALRYTEARMAKISEYMLKDIDKNTVEWTDNFDGSLKEPVVLPAILPNLLINGSSGIAVGMATNMAPHNLSQVIDGIIHVIDNPDISTVDLMETIQGPDFPTGGIIYGREGILNAYTTGRGLLRVRARADIEGEEKKKIIISELPYQVNKSNLLKNIAVLVKNKKIEGISDLRDESDRKGMRIVIDLKRDAIEDVVLNQLFEHTDMQSTFGVLNLAIVDGEPKVLTLMDIVKHYIEYRVEVITLRTRYDLKKAKEKIHILEGLIIALKNIDRVIKIIRQSKQVNEASKNLRKEFSLSENQAKAILDMRLQKLTGMEIQGLEKDFNDTKKLIEQLQELLSSKKNILNEIKKELLDLKDKFGDERRTEIVEGEIGIEVEDLIPMQDVVITITDSGYIKRIPTETYRTQHRGGKGLIGMKTKEEDLVVDSFITSTHDYIMFFTNHGKVFWLKGYKIPEGSRQYKGKAIINLLPRLEEGEYVETAIPVHEFDDERYLVFATKKGIIKKTVLSSYSNIRVNGIRAVNLDEDDELVNIKLSDGEQTIMIATANGQACRFNEQEVRPMGRVTRGVIGIRLGKGDKVVSMAVVGEKGNLLTVTENGYGKRSPIENYRKTHRGSKGVRTIITNERNGKVLFVREASDEDEIMLTTKNGMMVRVPVKDIRIQGRNTMGVRIMRLNEGDEVVSVSKVVENDDETSDINNES